MLSVMQIPVEGVSRINSSSSNGSSRSKKGRTHDFRKDLSAFQPFKSYGSFLSDSPADVRGDCRSDRKCSRDIQSTLSETVESLMVFVFKRSFKILASM